MDRTVLERKSVAELREIASTLGLRGLQRLKKAELIDRITASADGPDDGDGDRPSEADEGAASQPTLDDGSDGDGAGGGGAGDDDRDSDSEREQAARDEEGPDRSDRDRDDRGGDRARSERRRGRQRSDQNRGGDDQGRGDGQSRGDNQGRGEEQSDVEVREGVLDLLPEGYGFLRCTGYLAGSQDVYVSQSFVRRFDLRRGDLIAGPIRRNRNSDKFPALARVERIEGEPFDPRSDDARRPVFADLTPIFPDERLALSGPGSPVTPRVVDLFAPIGRGQRALVLAPPRAGKTTLLKQLAAAIEQADPDVHLVALLIDERPEEVTDLERTCGGEVVATTFDRPAEDHTQVAELVIERAKRLAERGRDVVVLLDSLTRLVRAYNVVVPSSGRVLPGGVDPAALYPAKRLFAAARNVEGPGSLTIIATALIADGSRMDEVIVEGFTDTANTELHLDAGLAQQRILPAIDVAQTGTRREELLLDEETLTAVASLRRELAGLAPDVGVPRLLAAVEDTTDNAALLDRIASDGLG